MTGGTKEPPEARELGLPSDASPQLRFWRWKALLRAKRSARLERRLLRAHNQIAHGLERFRVAWEADELNPDDVHAALDYFARALKTTKPPR